MSIAPRPPIPSLIPESAPFSPEQRTWLNGLFAGMISLEESVTPLSDAQAAKLLPRIGAGVIGAGFIAEIVPRALVAEWIGPGSGILGVVIATLGGALTPGGPVVGFSIGAAALKSGAGAPQVIIPQHYDQHYWARRVDQLGIGKAHAPSIATTESLGAVLSESLQPDIAARAQSLARLVRTDGVGIAAQQLAAKGT